MTEHWSETIESNLYSDQMLWDLLENKQGSRETMLAGTSEIMRRASGCLRSSKGGKT